MTVQPGIGERQGYFVPLAHHEVAERGRKTGGVLELAWCDLHRPCKVHRPAGVQHEIAEQVSFSVVEPHIMPVSSREHFPVHEPDVVAGRVFPVIGKLDGGPAIGGFVRTGEGAFRRSAGAEADMSQRLHAGQVEVGMNRDGHGGRGRNQLR